MTTVRVAIAAASLSLLASAASAATCPVIEVDEGPFGRSFTLTPQDGQTVSCYAYGTGNINGSIGQDPLLTNSDVAAPPSTIEFSTGVTPIDDLLLLDKSDAGGLLSGIIGGAEDEPTGTLDIDPADGYTSYILAIKSGNNANPSWAAWEVSDLGMFDWSISPGGGNSHTNLYGLVGAPNEIPLPAAGWLLLAGLGGLAVVKRRSN